MAASLPGSTPVENAANPSAGRAVMMDPLSGPQGSPFGGSILSWDADNHAVHTLDPTNLSTGALSTGIGFGSPPIFGLTAPASIQAAGFNDNYTPGVTKPDGTAGSNSTLVYIGGGRSDADGLPLPYDETAVGLVMAGNGAVRDVGDGTGFPVKTVTATGTVANGAAVEAGFVNRSGVSITTGQSVFGSSTTPNAVPV